MNTHDGERRDRAADRALAAAIRGASAPTPDAAAVQRIADGAWNRVHGLRPLHAPVALGSGTRRLAFAAAAAAGLLVALALQDARRPVLAVEGDPVQVWSGDGWRTLGRVPLDTAVYAPPGRRHLSLPDGSRVTPASGAVFRVACSTRWQGRYEVELLRGTVDVEGLEMEARAGEMRTRGGSTTGPVRFRLAADGAGATPLAAPAHPSLAGDDANRVPRVEVLSGTAEVDTGSVDGRILLARDQAATLVRLANHARARIARLLDFDESVLGDVLLGSEVLEARPAGGGAVEVILGGTTSGVRAVNVPPERVPATMDLLNTATVMSVSISVGIGGDEGDRWTGRDRVVVRRSVREFRHRGQDRETVITVGPAGARLERGEVAEDFAGLDALLQAHPDVKALFGGRLGTGD